jgi:DNA polymerase-3 subunit epsilon
MFFTMLPSKIAFVDIETTGTRSSYDRIIEIGILRVEENQLVDTFQTLINPQSYLPKEITQLTGITQQDIETAPTFRSVKDEIIEMLADCTFVAHNVRFDYAFLKHELLRENITYSSKHFCTVRLSRMLFPQWQRHNLDAVISGCKIKCANRHRAFDDAKVLYEFYLHILKTIPHEKLEKALAKTMKKPSLPINLPFEELDKLPEKPGVYIFYGSQTDNTGSGLHAPRSFSELEQPNPKSFRASYKLAPAMTTQENSDNSDESKNQKYRISDSPKNRHTESFEYSEYEKTKLFPTIPLYVGKSINIRNRVLSHFSSDIASATEMNIAQQVKHIETITTAGELGALLLESELIKKLLPIYNKKSRIKHELIAIKKRTNKQGYDECYLEPIMEINADSLQDFLGFYRSRKQAKATLADIAKTHMLCEKLLGLEKTMGGCFAYRLNRCNGACVGKEKALVYNLRLQTAFIENKILPWPFTGAILIQENEGVQNEFGLLGKSEYFLIDNWCYLGTVTVDADGNINDKSLQNASFDLDIYKILRQFLKRPENQKKIKASSGNKLNKITQDFLGDARR